MKVAWLEPTMDPGFWDATRRTVLLVLGLLLAFIPLSLLGEALDPNIPIGMTFALVFAATVTGLGPLGLVLAAFRPARSPIEMQPASKFASPRTFTTDELLTRYKEVLAAILPQQFLSSEGLLRLPSGEGDQIRIEVGADPLLQTSGFIAHITDRPLIYRLNQWRDTIGHEATAAIQTFVTDFYGGRKDSRIVLSDATESTFVHEVFHDIQAYFYDHHVQVHEALVKAVFDNKPAILSLYEELQRIPRFGNMVMFVPQHRWMFSYLPKQLFPTFQSDSPYAEVYLPIVAHFGWQTLFRIQEPVGQATVDLANQEVIPTLLAGVACGDARVAPVLREIFRATGLNLDFDERLARSPSGIKLLSMPASNRSRGNPEQAPRKPLVERPADVAKTRDGDRYPSLPSPEDIPRHRTYDAWKCPECNTLGLHVVITNALGLPIINKDWNARPVALDAIVCPQHWETQAALPLGLRDATVVYLLERSEFLAKCGYFDTAEMELRRVLNARPGCADHRVRLAHQLLDRMKLTRLLGQDAADTYPRPIGECVRQVTEVLESLPRLEPEQSAKTLLAHARLALETGDHAEAKQLLSKVASMADAVQADLEVVMADMRQLATAVEAASANNTALV